MFIVSILSLFSVADGRSVKDDFARGGRTPETCGMERRSLLALCACEARYSAMEASVESGCEGEKGSGPRSRTARFTVGQASRWVERERGVVQGLVFVRIVEIVCLVDDRLGDRRHVERAALS